MSPLIVLSPAISMSMLRSRSKQSVPEDWLQPDPPATLGSPSSSLLVYATLGLVSSSLSVSRAEDS